MIMFADGGSGLDEAQAAGHAKMQDDGTGSGVQQQIFCTPVDAVDCLSSEFPAEASGNRPAQVRVAHNDPGNPFARDVWGYSAAGGFDFREFGHYDSRG